MSKKAKNKSIEVNNTDDNMLTDNEKRGKRLKKKREQKGLTQEQLADKIFVTKQSIHNYEKGIRHFDYEKAVKLASVLGTNPEYLLNQSDNEYPIRTAIHNSKDYTLLAYLSFSYDIKICVVGSDPEDNTEKEIPISFIDRENPFEQLEKIDFSDSACRFILDKGKSTERYVDYIITSFIVNNRKYSYGEFVFIIREIQRDMDYKINNMEAIFDSYKRNVINGNAIIKDKIENKRLYQPSNDTVFYK